MKSLMLNHKDLILDLIAVTTYPRNAVLIAQYGTFWSVPMR